MRTTKLRKHRVFSRVFDTFSQCFKAETFRHGHNCGDHTLLFLITVDIGDKGTVNLDTFDWKATD